MNIERDKFLTEAMGALWHGWLLEEYGALPDNPDGSYGGMGNQCACGFKRENRVNWFVGLPLKLGHLCKNTDFSTPEGFFKLWNWARKQDWWTEFVKGIGYVMCDCGCGDIYVDQHWIDPSKFASSIYSFLKA